MLREIKCLHNNTFLEDEKGIGVRLACTAALLEVIRCSGTYETCTPDHLRTRAPGAWHTGTEEKGQCSPRERRTKGRMSRGRVPSTSSRNGARCACNAKLASSISPPPPPTYFLLEGGRCGGEASSAETTPLPFPLCSTTCVSRKFRFEMRLVREACPNRHRQMRRSEGKLKEDRSKSNSLFLGAWKR